MFGLFDEEKIIAPHYLFRVMHLLGNVLFFMFIKTNVLPPWVLVLQGREINISYQNYLEHTSSNK